MSKFAFLEFLKKEISKPYFEVLKKLTMLPNVTPKPNRVFFAFKNFDFDNLKVIIIGQDPYPNKGDADGMCFSSNATKCPASLKKYIYWNKKWISKFNIWNFFTKLLKKPRRFTFKFNFNKHWRKDIGT